MKRSRHSSIRRRLMILSATISLVTLVISGVVLLFNDLYVLRGQVVRDLEVLSAVVGNNCLTALVFDVPETAESTLGSLRQEPQIRYAIVYDAQGHVFAQYKRDQDQIVDRPMHTTEDGVQLNVSLLGVGVVEVWRELRLDGRRVGRIFIHAHTDQLRMQVNRYMTVTGILFILTMAASLLFALRLQRRVSAPILALAAKTREISERGDYQARLSQPASLAEIDTLVKGLDHLLEAIEDRETALKSHADALDSANASLRALAMEISLVEERERKRLAAELHDSAMQKLAIARLQIEAVGEQSESETEMAQDERLEVGLVLIREVLGELRSLQFELSPPALYLGGLPQALQSLAAHITKRCGLVITYTQRDVIPEPPMELAIVLFQCARELVYNLVKHARASQGNIQYSFDGGGFEVEVRDDGQGFQFDVETLGPGANGGSGLHSIRERLVVLGGRLHIRSGSDGSRVTIHVPMLTAVSPSCQIESTAH